MKKVIVLLLAMVAVGSLAFAIDSPEPQTYDLSASATAKWVYNLETQLHGFANTIDLKFRYYFINGASASKAGEGTYGKIEVTGITFKTKEVSGDGAWDGSSTVTTVAPDTDTVKDPFEDIDMALSASIVSGDLTVSIYGAPGADYNNAVYVPLFAKDKGYDPTSALKPAITVGGGLGFTYNIGTLGTIGAMIASAGAADSNDSFDDYAAGLDVTLKLVPDVLKLTAGVKTEFGNAQRTILTGKVDVTSGSLTAYAAIDALNGTSFVWDASAGVAYKLFEGKDSINFDAYYTDQLSPAPAAGKFPAAGTPHKGDFGLKFVDASGIVPNLNFTLGAFVDDVLADTAHDPMWLSVAASADYKAMLDDVKYVKPYGAYKMDLSGVKDSYLKVGLEAGLITNTTFDVNFQMGAENKDNNHVFAKNLNNDDRITVSAKVAL
jgi:hypothetical protein